MQINFHNLDVGSRTHNSKLIETSFISSSQIPHFSTEPEIENINLTQELDKEIGDKRQPWSMEDDKSMTYNFKQSNCGQRAKRETFLESNHRVL